MPNSRHYRIAEARPLAAEEKALLEWLVAHGSPNALRYQDQISRLTVIGRCGCGCPTIDLAVDGRQGSGGSDLIADMEGYSPEGISIGVILHAREGLLAELEVYATGLVEGPFTLPDPGRLRPFE